MRSIVVSDWLAKTEWATWHRAEMSGDASARRYQRLSGPDGASVILMDAPPAKCGSQARFVEIAAHLRALDLAAPRIHAWDDALGLMVLEDLGHAHFKAHLVTSPKEELRLYEAAVDVLVVLGAAPAPDGLQRLTPDVGAQMMDIAFEWAAKDHSPDLAEEIKSALRSLLTDVCPNPTTLSLRDFHAENLIWRPDQPGNKRVGLLDFQDAFVTHPAYDLASLLRDARRDVDPALSEPLLRRLGGGDAMTVAFHLLAVQRNLRILGIFERLAQQAGKTRYLDLIPRVWAHIRTDLASPHLAGIAPLIHRAFDPVRPVA